MLLRALPFLALVAVASCDLGPEPKQKQLRLLVTPDTLFVADRDTVVLTASVVDDAGVPVDTGPVVWTSRNSTVASVSESGVVTTPAGSSGTTRVVAQLETLTDSATVRVTRQYVWPETALLTVGASRALKVETFSPSQGVLSPSASGWVSSNPGIVSVDASGLVTAMAAGSSTVSATLNGRSVSALVRVVAYDIPLRFKQVSMGAEHVCGLTEPGQVYCWGSDAAGQIGTTEPLDQCTGVFSALQPRFAFRCSLIPMRAQVPEAVREIAAFGGTCALGVSNTLYCWGDTFGSATFGKPTQWLSTLVASVGRACAVTQDAKVVCWGSDQNGARGDGPLSAGAAPSAVAGTRTWAAVSTMNGVGCALETTGVPYCWGPSPSTGSDAPVRAACFVACNDEPTAVQYDERFADIRLTSIVTTGESESCGRAANGLVYCWGGTSFTGRPVSLRLALGIPGGGLSSIQSPTDGVPGHLRPICGLTDAGDAHCVKYRSSGPLDSAFVFAPVTLGVKLKQIQYREGGPLIACGIAKDDFTYCWGGASLYHMLGVGGFGFVSVPGSNPVKVAGQ